MFDTPADADNLKQALRRLGGGVSIVTAGEGDVRSGATVTSATALSVDPPRMLVSLNRTSSTWPVVERFRHFAVNVVGSEHQGLANRFAGIGGVKGVERYLGTEWTRLASGAPVLEDAVAALDCEVEEAIERHSHVIIIGRVLTIRLGHGNSLLYQNGRYHSVD
ncbi:flavin reductase family protein [Rhizobium sp. 32-5/1]|uniref:flavin reductase family protein n=1 Tax=Rhizobium sp. 32-5/1 TaxID=3019602 RepID=UPI00240E9942|nr:flavin reductase family protein [Rhizobium sp. 32-5/1]WEZ85005.1 flavin reductase family protein [Rhizobium sp. 32-5/1]